MAAKAVTDDSTKTDDAPKDDPPATDPPKDDAPPVEPPADDDAATAEIDWKAKARKEERRAKEERAAAREAKKVADEATKRLKEIEDADLSEKEKAEAKATDLEAKLVATTEKARKANLRAAIADSATKVASVSDVAALLTADGIEFDDDNEPIDFETKLSERIEKSPHLAAGPGRVQGSSDAGRGSGGTSSLEDMSVEEHLKRMRKQD